MICKTLVPFSPETKSFWLLREYLMGLSPSVGLESLIRADMNAEDYPEIINLESLLRPRRSWIDFWESINCPLPSIEKLQLSTYLLYRLSRLTSVLWIFRNTNSKPIFNKYMFALSHMPQCHFYIPSYSREENLLNLSEQGIGFPFQNMISSSL